MIIFQKRCKISERLKSAIPPMITGVEAYTNIDNEILIEHDPSDYGFFKEYRYYVEEVEE